MLLVLLVTYRPVLACPCYSVSVSYLEQDYCLRILSLWSWQDRADALSKLQTEVRLMDEALPTAGRGGEFS